jgi:hypothetical protein
MNIEHIKTSIATEREQLVTHPLYASIKTIDDIRVFMEHHVYAVWDFMSLLKSLQLGLTCTRVPWTPKGSALTRYLINEIVTGEECDIHPNGGRASHFELYHDAMSEAGCNVHPVDNFINQVNNGSQVAAALNNCNAPVAAAQFVHDTFGFIGNDKLHIVASVFTFGREDLIPDMFLKIVKEVSTEHKGALDIFLFYLERHIEVDGEHHSHLAHEMVAELCGNDEQKWEEAIVAAKAALNSRLALWDGIYKEINKK